jgi:ABC-2 type transport system ATP-binding protein
VRSGRIQILGATDDLLATHKLLIGPSIPRRPRIVGVEQVVSIAKTDRQATLLVRTNGDVLDPLWDQHDVSLEDVVLGYLSAPAVDASLLVEDAA